MRRPPQPPEPFEPGGRVTGIGSLPGRDYGEAVRRVFRMGPGLVPFLPELPRRSLGDGMLRRALRGLPGSRARRDGAVEIGPSAGERSGALALPAGMGPFLDAVARARPEFAKVQFAGPLTTAIAALDPAGRPALASARLASRVRVHVTRVALAAARAVARRGARPIVFLDEPGLVSFHRDPRPFLAPVLARLRRAGVVSGVHCCAETDWGAILACGPDVLSFDAEISFESVISNRRAIERHLARGGSLAPGVVSTRPAARLGRLQAIGWTRRLRLSRIPLSRLLLTPACGTGTLAPARDRAVWRQLFAIAARLRS